MTVGDIDGGLRLCRLSHWNQVARDWAQFLSRAPGGATVAVADDGLVIGTVATLRYAAMLGYPIAGGPVPGTRPPEPGSLAWIAMVLVDPACRGGGIGTSLLQDGLARVADVPAVGLDATPLGQPLYEALGFEADTRFTRMLMASPAASGVGRRASVRQATREDLDAIARLDAQTTGLERRDMLTWLYDGAPEFAWVSDGPRGLTGALLGRHGHTADHLGPIHAASADVALGLVATCLARHVRRSVLLDVADDRPGWRAGVEALGFAAQRPFTRMYRGRWRPGGDATHLYASIGPEFG